MRSVRVDGRRGTCVAILFPITISPLSSNKKERIETVVCVERGAVFYGGEKEGTTTTTSWFVENARTDTGLVPFVSFVVKGKGGMY